jgi:hypothetical protein
MIYLSNVDICLEVYSLYFIQQLHLYVRNHILFFFRALQMKYDILFFYMCESIQKSNNHQLNYIIIFLSFVLAVLF